MAQEVERRLGKAEATGSNPVSSLRSGEYSILLLQRADREVFQIG